MQYTRRDIFQQSLLAAGVFGLSSPVDLLATPAPPLPAKDLLDTKPDQYWAKIRDEQFLLPGWRAYLNNGTLGALPKPVLKAMIDDLVQGAAMDLVPYNYPRWGYETLDEWRREMAEFVGCEPEELAFTHNCTEAMNYIANGLELKAGDEVLITDQEHPSGREPWLLRQKRHGIKVREIKIPIPPESPDQLVETVISAIGPKTRVVSFSGITTKTGLLFPIKQICHELRSRNIISVVDGAHMNGQVPVNLHDLECDFFAGSPHKWMFAPAGSGLLFARKEWIPQFWPTVVTGDWDKLELAAARYMRVGTNNRAIFRGMMEGLRFLKALGPENVYNRIHSLAQLCRRMAQERSYLQLLTPEDDRLYAAMVTFKFNTSEDRFGQFLQQLQKARIWTVAGNPFRISTHIHTRPEDLEAFFQVADRVFA